MNLNTNGDFFWIIKKSEYSPSGQVYLGAFLAMCIFGAIYIGDLLFLIIVVLASLFIFLSKEDGNKNQICTIGKKSIIYEEKEYFYEDLLEYSILENIWDIEVKVLALKSKNLLNTTIFIPIDLNVEINKIRAIIPKSLKENNGQDISLLDKIMLRFFI